MKKVSIVAVAVFAFLLTAVCVWFSVTSRRDDAVGQKPTAQTAYQIPKPIVSNGDVPELEHPRSSDDSRRAHDQTSVASEAPEPVATGGQAHGLGSIAAAPAPERGNAESLANTPNHRAPLDSRVSEKQVTPSVMTDYQTWTVIGATEEPVDQDTTRFSGGMAVAHSNGVWITSDEGIVTHTNGRINAIAMPGEVHADTTAGMLQTSNAVIRDGPHGGVSVTADAMAFHPSRTATNRQQESGHVRK